MKENLEYYPHRTESDNHGKFKALRSEYGWEGEGRFWALNNRIASAKGCVLDLSKKYTRRAIATDLDFDIEEFEGYIQFLLSDECELIVSVDNDIWKITTEDVQQAFRKVDADRQSARDRKLLKSKSSAKQSKGSANSGEGSEKFGKQNKKQNKTKQNQTKSNQTKQNKSSGASGSLPAVSSQNQGGHYSNSQGIETHLKQINVSCGLLQDRVPGRNMAPFNAYQWVQLQVNQRKHPGAIDECLRSLINAWNKIQTSYVGYLTNTMKKINGNYYEADSRLTAENYKQNLGGMTDVVKSLGIRLEDIGNV